MSSMSEKIRCTVLTKEDVSLKGHAITFDIYGEKDTFYLSRNAMLKLINQMSAYLSEKSELGDYE